MKKDLKFAEKLVYYGYCLTTLGLMWGIKIVIKKAIIEANNELKK